MLSLILKDEDLSSAVALLSAVRAADEQLIKGVFLEEGLYIRPISPDTFSHSLELLLSRQWLHTHLTGMEEKIQLLENFLANDPSQTPLFPTQPAEEGIIREISVELNRFPLNILALRARTLLLLSNMLRRWPPPVSSAPSPRKTWHEQTMQQVEKRLLKSLEERLPSQKQLAREFALSESTLKRQFKAFYGKTLYEYYLERKMEQAKWLLQEKKISVSETAYTLGYEKVSAFISMFKKYHKVLPGSLKAHHH